jgi:hypothetical protein
MRPPGGILSPGESIIATGNISLTFVSQKISNAWNLVNPLTIVSHVWQYSSLLSHRRTMRNQLIKKVRLSSKS